MVEALCTAGLFVRQLTGKGNSCEDVLNVLLTPDELCDEKTRVVSLFAEFNNTCEGINNLVNLHFAIMQLRGKWGEDTGEDYAAKEVHEEDLNQQVVDLLNDKEH